MWSTAFLLWLAVGRVPGCADTCGAISSPTHQLAKYERAKIVERRRRGKLRKAREGKAVAGHTPNYGFQYNASRDGYEVDEEKMGPCAASSHGGGGGCQHAQGREDLGAQGGAEPGRRQVLVQAPDQEIPP